MNARSVLIPSLLVGALLVAGAAHVRRGPDGGGRRYRGATDAPGVPVSRGRDAPDGPDRIAHIVRTVPLRRDSFVRWTRGWGRATALRRATLRAEAAGRVLGAPVGEGGLVGPGDLLVQLDTARAHLRLRAARAELERARLEYRGLTFDDTLLGLDPAAVGRRRRNARARAGLDRARAELDLARLELEGRAMRAPFGGRVAGLAVAPGTQVLPGDSLAAVVDPSRLTVVATVLEESVAAVREGAGARVQLAAFPGDRRRAKVVAVSPIVELASGRAKVIVRLEGAAGGVRPGMYGEVAIASGALPDQALVPLEAVVRRGERDVIFLFRPDGAGARRGAAEWIDVEVVASGDGLAAVRPVRADGRLEPGTPVLVEGHELLAHGAPVELAASRPEAAER